MAARNCRIDAIPIIDRLIAHECRFVVVGSWARRLLGESVEPADLDLVIDGGLANQQRVAAALIELGARVETPLGRQAVGRFTRFPWDWSWTVATRWGPVDLIVAFPDGRAYELYAPAASTVDAGGCSVLVHPTRYAA